MITYKSISVGDDISKIEDAFDYEYQNNDNSYVVVFNDKNEEVDINPILTKERENDIAVNITYLSEDSKIKRIVITKRDSE